MSLLEIGHRRNGRMGNDAVITQATTAPIKTVFNIVFTKLSNTILLLSVAQDEIFLRFV